MKTKPFITALISTIFLISMFAPLFVFAKPEMAPRIHILDGTSTNWSGYAVQTDLANPQSGVVTDVKGTWIVPAITGNAKNTYSSFWVGIDGYSSGSVEQIGTDSDTDSQGNAVYYAWYEMYPKYPFNIRMTIQAGDQITAEVSYSSKNGRTSQFTLTLTDATTGKTFSTTQKANNVERSSAEWVAEAPSSMSGVLPLANFGTVSFSSCSATINGHTGSIDDSNWQNDAMTMVTSSGTTKAAPSALTGGNSFTVTWAHA